MTQSTSGSWLPKNNQNSLFCLKKRKRMPISWLSARGCSRCPLAGNFRPWSDSKFPQLQQQMMGRAVHSCWSRSRRSFLSSVKPSKVRRFGTGHTIFSLSTALGGTVDGEQPAPSPSKIHCAQEETMNGKSASYGSDLLNERV